jgi:hypothetical protein
MKRNIHTEHRDEALGTALRELEVPEHAPDFQARLDRRLAEEGVRHLPRRRSPRRALPVALVAAAAAIVVVAIGVPRTERAGPEVATAAQITAKVRTALSAMRNLSGVVIADGPEPGDEQRWQFTSSVEGDLRLVGPTQGEVITYEATSGVSRSVQKSASAGGDTLFYAERRGVAPGLPDLGPPTWIIPNEFGAFVRALLAADDPRVQEIVFQGRRAWRLDVDTVPNAIVPELSADRFQITVDRRTGIPVRVVELRNGSFLRELRIERLAVDRDLPADTFRLDFPAGAEVMRSDDGFRRVDLEQAVGIVGYRPLVPAWVPAGYELAEVAVATQGGPTGKEAGNPTSRMVVSLSYRRGLDQFLVTSRLSEGPRHLWTDPLATGEGYRDDPERIAIRQGALAGTRAALLAVPRGIPHVWAITNELVVTVSGNLSRGELVRVTESLRRHT